jgi:hypothetical protein
VNHGVRSSAAKASTRAEPSFVTKIGIEARRGIAYSADMVAPNVLLQHLLEVDENRRVELAYALLDLDETGRNEIAQALLGSVDDGMSESERAELGAALDRSLAELAAGKGIPIEDAMARLRARRLRRAALQYAGRGQGPPL